MISPSLPRERVHEHGALSWVLLPVRYDALPSYFLPLFSLLSHGMFLQGATIHWLISWGWKNDVFNWKNITAPASCSMVYLNSKHPNSQAKLRQPMCSRLLWAVDDRAASQGSWQTSTDTQLKWHQLDHAWWSSMLLDGTCSRGDEAHVRYTQDPQHSALNVLLWKQPNFS